MRKIAFLILSIFTISSSIAQINSSTKSKNQTELNLTLSDDREILNDGIIYRIEKDNQTLSAHKNGKQMWKTNIIKVCGKPDVGNAQIRYIKLNKEKINVIFGKHSFVEVDIKTGKTKFLGAD
ncbi:hypothetical protein [Flavobacterium noncentrifugens]|nr:hypothetical protein [Flavobacterium noncentrifugens]